MQELQDHCDGTSEGERRKQVSREYLKKIFYKNETTFTFEKYVTKLKGIFNVLEKYGVPIYKEQMVKYLLDHIMSPKTELKTEFNICRSSHSSTSAKASTYVSKVVSRLYTCANPSSGSSIKRSMYAAVRGDPGDGRGVVAEDLEEEVDEIEEETSEEVVEGEVAHMKMELTSQMSPVTLKIQSGPHSQRIKGKGSLRARYAQISCKIKRGEPPALSVLKSTTRSG